MLKSVLANNHAWSQIESNNHEDAPEFSYGLIIGQRTADQKEMMVVHLARTPPADEDSAEEVSRLEDIDLGWLEEHAKQVTAMLPGGMFVLGAYFMTRQDLFSSQKDFLRQTLSAISRVSESSSSSSLYLVLHNQGRALVKCQYGSNDFMTMRPVELDETRHTFKWHCLKSTFILDTPVAFTQQQTEWPLKQKLEVALAKVNGSLEKAVVLLNGCFKPDNELLEQPSNKKKSKKNTTTSSEDSEDDSSEANRGRHVVEYEADILTDESINNLQEECGEEQVHSNMRIVGRMSLRAFVHQKATYGEAFVALKQDVMRALSARLDMHCDSLVGEEMRGTEDELPILHEPPRRVNVKLPDSEIIVSDFLFPGESPDESVKAIEQMFGFSPTFEHLDDEQEIVASPNTVMMSDDAESRAESPALERPGAQSHCSPMHILLSMIVATLAIGASYLLTLATTEENFDEDQFTAPNEPPIQH